MPWLDALRARLDAAPGPVTFFFRDDDGGWDDGRLCELLDRFARHGLPLDVAVIPCALEPPLAAELCARHAAADGRLGLHQHGYAHRNHETEGRKQEFGPARSREEIRHDLDDGRRRLAAALGDALDPVFTPPWNRCTRETGECLAELGFEIVSREARVAPLDVPGLAEVPVHVDWFAKRKGVRLDREAVGGLLAAAVDGPTVGVMFHHAEMDATEMAAADDLLALLAGHERCRFARIPELAGSVVA
jgi:peptidoglycan/xylan/chitin deacetylase (PgdA/CDA1 family)